MAFPTLSKSGVTSVVFSRGDVYPTRKVVQPRQKIGVSESGAVYVATLSAPETRHVLTFDGLTGADYTNLLAFLSHALINWTAFSWTYTDVAGVTYTVRYMSGIESAQETSSGRWSVTLELREEMS